MADKLTDTEREQFQALVSQLETQWTALVDSVEASAEFQERLAELSADVVEQLDSPDGIKIDTSPLAEVIENIPVADPIDIIGGKLKRFPSELAAGIVAYIQIYYEYATMPSHVERTSINAFNLWRGNVRIVSKVIAGMEPKSKLGKQIVWGDLDLAVAYVRKTSRRLPDGMDPFASLMERATEAMRTVRAGDLKLG